MKQPLHRSRPKYLDLDRTSIPTGRGLDSETQHLPSVFNFNQWGIEPGLKRAVFSFTVNSYRVRCRYRRAIAHFPRDESYAGDGSGLAKIDDQVGTVAVTK